MKLLPIFLLLCLGVVAIADDAFRPVDLTARVEPLKGISVFKITDAEVTVNGSVLKRIELGKGTAVLSYKSKLEKSASPKFEIGIYNAYGARLSSIHVNWMFSMVGAGEVKQENVTFYPNDLREVLQYSTVSLPKDWETPVFVTIKGAVF